MDPPTIAIDARYIRAPLSGIGRYTRNLLSGLARTNVARPIIVFVTPGIDLPQHVVASPQLKLVELAASPYSFADQRYLPAILRRNNIAMFHTMDAFAPLAVGFPKKVITIYDLIPLVCKKDMPGSKKAKFSFVWRKWLKMQCRTAAAIVTISQVSARDICRELGVPQDRITVIPSGIDQSPPIISAGPNDMAAPTVPLEPSTLGVERSTLNVQRPTSNAAPYILYAGRRDPYKNIVRLIEAFAQAAKFLPEPLHLVIAGAPDARYMEPEAAAERLGVKSRIRFVGHVSDDQLAALYAGATAFVFPSLYEGQGLPPLEAMSFGVPVIASNRAAIPETVGDAALLVDPTNVSEIAAAIVKVLSDPVLAADLSRRGKARAAEFTVRRQAEATLELYQRLLQG